MNRADLNFLSQSLAQMGRGFVAGKEMRLRERGMASEEKYRADLGEHREKTLELQERSADDLANYRKRADERAQQSFDLDRVSNLITLVKLDALPASEMKKLSEQSENIFGVSINFQKAAAGKALIRGQIFIPGRGMATVDANGNLRFHSELSPAQLQRVRRLEQQEDELIRNINKHRDAMHKEYEGKMGTLEEMPEYMLTEYEAAKQVLREMQKDRDEIRDLLDEAVQGAPSYKGEAILPQVLPELQPQQGLTPSAPALIPALPAAPTPPAAPGPPGPAFDDLDKAMRDFPPSSVDSLLAPKQNRMRLNLKTGRYE